MNAFTGWLVPFIPLGAFVSYVLWQAWKERDRLLLEHMQAVQDLTLLLQAVGNGAPRSLVIPVVEASSDTVAVERDGEVVAGALRLRFDADGRMTEVQPLCAAEPIREGRRRNYV